MISLAEHPILETSHPYELLFPFVSKPSRYTGSEWNSISKPRSFREGAVGLCLCFPDLYETGFANTGIEILYQITNARNDAYAERAYAPDLDMGDLLRKKGFPLFSLENRTPLSQFDIVGFGLPYELCYTNILEMLDLSGIPLLASERSEKFPLIIGGGPCSVNPEPLADFFDAIVIGDGEDAIGEIIDAVKLSKEKKSSKEDLLIELSKISGVYVPSLYEVKYQQDGTIESFSPKISGVPKTVAYRRADITSAKTPFPDAPVVPYVQTVHDRLNIEIQRGCVWRCRFCQAGYTYHPYRERDMETLIRLAEDGIKNTGYEAVTLAGLSAADHSNIIPLLKTLTERLSQRRISIGLPSTRLDRFTLSLAEMLNTVRRQSVTFAPEAGSERLRRVIRKNLSDSEIAETLKVASLHGWKTIKLYFMIGFPTETWEDLESIVKIVRASRKENPGLSFTVTVSPFVPKPHTPLQWMKQENTDVLKEKLFFFKKNLPAQIRAHGLEQIVVEGMLSRGDRRCSSVLLEAWKMGAKFDEWGEKFRPELWQKAFEMTNLDPGFYCDRERLEDEILPWDHLECGPGKKALWNDLQSALRQSDEPEPVPVNKERPEVPTVKKVELLPEQAVQRIRFKMARSGNVRFLSHLEQIEMIRRALRRSGLSLAHTAGFHPQIRCAFSPAISVGYESDCEYFDVDLSKRMELSDAQKQLSGQMPAGFSITKASRIPLFFPSLESLINCTEYEVTVPPTLLKEWDLATQTSSLETFLKRGEIILEKKKKDKRGNFAVQRIDIRPLILRMECLPAENETLTGARYRLLLKFGPGKNIKPEKVMGLFLGLSEDETRILIVKRRAFYAEKADGALTEP